MSGSAAPTGTWDETKWQRYGLLAGVVFVVLNMVSNFSVPAPPSRDAPGAEITEYVVDNAGALKFALVVFSFAMFFGVWWLGSLWRVIGRLEPDGPRLAFIAAVGFILTGALLTIGQALFTTAALRPDTLNGSAEFTWTAGYLVFALIMPMIAVHMAALAILIMWKRFLPQWMAWLALLATVAALIATVGAGTEADAFAVILLIAFLAWMLWILLASILLFRSSAG